MKHSKSLDRGFYILLGIGFIFAIFCAALISNPAWLKSIITHRQKITTEITPEGDFAYRFSLPFIAQQSTLPIVVYENDIPLTEVDQTALGSIIQSGSGKYGRDLSTFQNSKYIYFSSTDNSDPRANGKIYTIKYVFPVLTRTRVIILLVFDLAGMVLVLIGWMSLRKNWQRALTIWNWITQHQTIILLLGLALIAVSIHWICLADTPIQSRNDTSSYIDGAIRLAFEGTLAGVHPKRGPGMAILLAPFFGLFENHLALPVKIFFHLLGVGGALLVYGIGFQLTRKPWFAFLCGLLAALRPDIANYGNMLLSEAPTFFFTMLFVFLAIKYFTSHQLKWLYLAAIGVSFLTMLRTENRLLMIVFFVFVGVEIIWKWIKHEKKSGLQMFIHGLISGLIPVMTILGWSFHNLNTHGFFGLTNYNYTQIYAGVITSSYQVGQEPPITNWNSPSMQKIDEAVQTMLQKGIEKYPERVTQNYQAGAYGAFDRYAVQNYYGISDQESASVFTQAAIDTLKAKPFAYIELLFLKLKVAFMPNSLYVDNQGISNHSLLPYFQDNPSIRDIFQFPLHLQQFYYDIYALMRNVVLVWRFIGILGLGVCLLRKPSLPWWFLCGAAFTSAVFPVLLALPHTRYTVYGGSLLNLTAVGTIWLILEWVKNLRAKNAKQRTAAGALSK